jgi:hypothetical protein
MSTPNPELAAAAPTLIKAIQALQTALNTTLTGDPLLIPQRAGAAILILDGQLGLLLPSLATAEVGAVNTGIQTTLGGWITKLQSLTPPAA